MDTQDDALFGKDLHKGKCISVYHSPRKRLSNREIVYIANEAILKVTYFITSNVATAALWFLLIVLQLSEQVYFQVKTVN